MFGGLPVQFTAPLASCPDDFVQQDILLLLIPRLVAILLTTVNFSVSGRAA